MTPSRGSSPGWLPRLDASARLYLLWAFVFTVPWDNFPLPFVGSVSRVFGLAVVGAALVTTAMEGRFRKPDAVLGFAIAFSVWGTLSLLWTMSYGNTVVLATTYAQLVASVWVIRGFVRTREQVQPLLAAICFGLFVPLTDLLNNLGSVGNQQSKRFTGIGLADGAGLSWCWPADRLAPAHAPSRHRPGGRRDLCGDGAGRAAATTRGPLRLELRLVQSSHSVFLANHAILILVGMLIVAVSAACSCQVAANSEH